MTSEQNPTTLGTRTRARPNPTDLHLLPRTRKSPATQPFQITHDHIAAYPPQGAQP